MTHTREFKVISKSSNTNSFGLHQMIIVSKCGKAYKTHASKYSTQYSAKDPGETVNMQFSISPSGKEYGFYIIGHEMLEKLPDVPAETVKLIFK